MTKKDAQNLPRGAVLRINHLGSEFLARNNGVTIEGKVNYSAIGGGGSVCDPEHHVIEVVDLDWTTSKTYAEAEAAHWNK